MSKAIPRRCKIFNCTRRHGNFCCADCGYKASGQCKNPCLNHPTRCGQERTETPKEMATAAGIRFINATMANAIIESRKPLGLFVHREKGKFIGIDNRTGDAWTEEFTTQAGCLKWLVGSMPREAIKE